MQLPDWIQRILPSKHKMSDAALLASSSCTAASDIAYFYHSYSAQAFYVAPQVQAEFV